MSVIKAARFIPLLNCNISLDINFYNTVIQVSHSLVAAPSFATIRPAGIW